MRLSRVIALHQIVWQLVASVGERIPRGWDVNDLALSEDAPAEEVLKARVPRLWPPWMITENNAIRTKIQWEVQVPHTLQQYYRYLFSTATYSAYMSTRKKTMPQTEAECRERRSSATKYKDIEVLHFEVRVI